MATSLLTYDQALEVIRALVKPRGSYCHIPVDGEFGFALAQPVIALEPNPRFDNSEVDGYAIGSANDCKDGCLLEVKGIIGAGESSDIPIAPGTAVRILTGAPIPLGTYSVVMQEDVVVEGSFIRLHGDFCGGDHIRARGADFDAGEILAPVGTALDSGVSALLAFVGLNHPLVYRRPVTTIITTGDELVGAEETPVGAQIRDTNSVMLSYQVRAAIGATATLQRVADNREALKAVLKESASVSDCVIVSGGASVGDRDFIGEVLAELGQVAFHGVSIRPGKPVLFGQIGDCLVFGLPGNPASAFVCFEIFVREALRRLAGWRESGLLWTFATCGFDHKAMGREDFVRVRLEEGLVVPAKVQGSFGIRSIAEAQGLVRLSDTKDVISGSRCSVTWFR